jgi:hypothetical protein
MEMTSSMTANGVKIFHCIRSGVRQVKSCATVTIPPLRS